MHSILKQLNQATFQKTNVQRPFASYQVVCTMTRDHLADLDFHVGPTAQLNGRCSQNDGPVDSAAWQLLDVSLGQPQWEPGTLLYKDASAVGKSRCGMSLQTYAGALPLPASLYFPFCVGGCCQSEWIAIVLPPGKENRRHSLAAFLTSYSKIVFILSIFMVLWMFSGYLIGQCETKQIQESPVPSRGCEATGLAQDYVESTGHGALPPSLLDMSFFLAAATGAGHSVPPTVAGGIQEQ